MIAAGYQCRMQRAKARCTCDVGLKGGLPAKPSLMHIKSIHLANKQSPWLPALVQKLQNMSGVFANDNNEYADSTMNITEKIPAL
jgi:hypothetical protein